MKNLLGGTGYTLKNIALKDDAFGTVSGTAPNLTITLNKTGGFNATLTLSKGVTTESISAEIEAVLPNLTFPKFIIGYKSALTKTEIFAKVSGNSTGYSIETITLGSGADTYATATATGLDIKKVGAFTATLTLTNPNYFEVSIANAQFQIDKNPAPDDLTFTTLQKTYSSGGSFTAGEILGQVNGTKTGYTLKAIENLSPAGIAQIAADKKSLQFTKVGNFTATLVLENPTKVEVSIAKAKFEIVKRTYTGVFKFLGLTKYVTGGIGNSTITGAQIMSQILGASDGGFTLKSVALDNSSFATVSGTKPNFTLTPKKAGSFTATIVLEHDIYADVTIKGAKFLYRIFEKILSGSEIYGLTEASDGSLWVAGGKNAATWVSNLSKDGNVLLDKNFVGRKVFGITEDSDGSLWVTGNVGDGWTLRSDAKMLKFSKDGSVLLDKTYGGSDWEDAYSIVDGSDGSMWVAGYAKINGTGNGDMWVLKCNKDNASVLLDKTYGGSDWEEARSITEDSDGNIWVAGYTSSKGNGGSDAWVLKLSKDNGSVLLDKTYGGSGSDDAYSVIEARDGSIWVVGSTTSRGAGMNDAWVLKLNKDDGSVLLDKTYGGTKNDFIESIVEARDGSIWVVGSTTSRGAGKSDAWVLKLNKDDGSVLLDKTYGDWDMDKAFDVIEDVNGNIWIAGNKGAKAWILGGINR